MPRIIKRVFKKKREKTMLCPNCGAPLLIDFDGRRARFKYNLRVFAAAEGSYEAVYIKCPSCGADIEFKRREVEE